MQRYCFTLGLLTLALLAGCQSNPTPASQPAVHKVLTEESCANRLHTISGGLLLYYSTQHALPKSLNDLIAVPSTPNHPNLVCPDSGKPYIYAPQGLPVAGRSDRVIVYDAQPSHSGQRLAIAIDEISDDKPLITRVVSIPESAFTLK